MGLGGFLAAQSEVEVRLFTSLHVTYNSIINVKKNVKNEKSRNVPKKKRKNAMKSSLNTESQDKSLDPGLYCIDSVLGMSTSP
jgi:hypothetical protein